jgi:hypothetical protein
MTRSQNPQLQIIDNSRTTYETLAKELPDHALARGGARGDLVSAYQFDCARICGSG